MAAKGTTSNAAGPTGRRDNTIAAPALALALAGLIGADADRPIALVVVLVAALVLVLVAALVHVLLVALVHVYVR
ncbi:hypothetical protein [Streptomyces sp. NPDC101393]|uniref:hypothetical protein n=1 Tax=Streptomyces sp. NPDC101393 TaxID=3366141 RepID=UPI00382FEC33